MKFLVDTDTLVHMLRHRPDSLRRRFIEFDGDIFASTLSVMELHYGVEVSQHRRQNELALADLLVVMNVVDFDAEAARESARVRAELRQAGTPIGPIDTLLAGQARSRGMILVSNNLREFSRVDRLVVESWLVD